MEHISNIGTIGIYIVNFEAIFRLKITFHQTLLLKMWGKIWGWDLFTRGTWICPATILHSIQQRLRYKCIVFAKILFNKDNMLVL